MLVRRRTRDRGIALILALLVLILLILLVGQMAIGTRHDRTLALNRLADLQNTYGARAGWHRASLVLQADLDQGGDVDTLGERWAQPLEFELGRGTVRTVTLDSERFISLSRLVDDKGEVDPAVAGRLRRLVRNLRHPPDAAERIIDYIDADSKGAYESRARNARLLNAEELLRVEGLAPEVLYGGTVGGEERRGILDFLTVWPRTSSSTTPSASQINLNTAAPEVLEALAEEMTPTLALAIAAWREQPGPDGRPQGFKKVEDLKSVPGMSQVYGLVAPSCTVKASTFEIRARAAVGNVEKTWVFVAQRDAKGKMTLLSSQKQQDFLTVKPEALPE